LLEKWEFKECMCCSDSVGGLKEWSFREDEGAAGDILDSISTFAIVDGVLEFKEVTTVVFGAREAC
jgi:hypothetical protein